MYESGKASLVFVNFVLAKDILGEVHTPALARKLVQASSIIIGIFFINLGKYLLDGHTWNMAL